MMPQFLSKAADCEICVMWWNWYRFSSQSVDFPYQYYFSSAANHPICYWCSASV